MASHADSPRPASARIALALMFAAACSAGDHARAPLAPGAAREPARTALPVGTGWPESRWEELPSLPVPLTEHGLVVYRGCLWTIGGELVAGSVWTSAVYRYCPDRDPSRWHAGPSLPEPMSSFVGVGVLGDRIYVAGGIDGSGTTRRTVYAFDAGSGWSRLADSLPTRMACGGGVTVEGRLYVYGGLPWTDYAPNCDFRRTPNELAIFDPTRPSGQRWTRVGPSPFSETVCAYRLAAIDRQVNFVGGGTCVTYDPHVHPYVYDVASNAWAATSRYFRAVLWAGVATIGRTVVTFGGSDDNVWYPIGRDAYAVELETKSGGPLPRLPEDKVNAPAVNFRGDVVIVGNGSPSIGNPSKQVLRYRMATGCDLYEPDDAPASAAALPLVFDRGGEPWPWRTTLGRICAPEDVDYIRLEEFQQGYVGTAVRLAPPTGTDYELALMDSTGSHVVARSARAGSAVESIRLPGDDASYLLRIRSQDGSFDVRRPYDLWLVR